MLHEESLRIASSLSFEKEKERERVSVLTKWDVSLDVLCRVSDQENVSWVKLDTVNHALLLPTLLTCKDTT